MVLSTQVKIEKNDTISTCVGCVIIVIVLVTDTKYGMKSDIFMYFRLTIQPVYIGDYNRRKKGNKRHKKETNLLLKTEKGN